MEGEDKQFNLEINEDELTEVVLSDEPVIDDNDEEDIEEINADEVIQEAEPEEEIVVNDISNFTFDGHTDSVYCVKIHPTVKDLVVSGGGDDKAYLWKYQNNASSNNSSNVSTNSLQRIVLEGHTDTISTVGFNYDGSLVLTGSYDGTIRVWNAYTGVLQCILEGPEDIEWCQWHSKGNAIIAGSKDSTMWMWLTAAVSADPAVVAYGKCVQVFAGHDGMVSAGCFTSDGKGICSGGEDGSVRVWAPKTGVCKHIFQDHFGHQGQVTCVMSHPYDDDVLLTGGMDGVVILYQLSNKRILQKFVHAEPVPDTSASAGNTRSAANNDGDDAMDIDNEEEDAGVLVNVTSVECIGICTHHQFKLVASGGADKCLKIWDTVTGQCRATCVHQDVVTALQWHTLYPVVCTSSVDMLIRLWDARSGLCLQSFSGHRNMIISFDMAVLSPAIPTNTNNSPLPPLPPNSTNVPPTDVIISTSDDYTCKVFYYNILSLFA